MHNRIDAMLDRCGDFDGPLPDEVRAKFWAFFLNPNPESWHAIQAQTFLFWKTGLAPKAVWTEVVRRYPHYASMMGHGRGAKAWKGVPDVFVVYRVMNELTLGLLKPSQLDKTR